MTLYNLNLTDTVSGAKITGLKTREELEQYFTKRGIGTCGGTVNYQLDGNIKVDAKDLKNHTITGICTKI